MYQLFIFFMVTDPEGRGPIEDGARWSSSIAVAFVEMLLRLNEVIYAPFYALFLVGPAALLIEMGSIGHRASRLRAQGSEAHEAKTSSAKARSSRPSLLPCLPPRLKPQLPER